MANIMPPWFLFFFSFISLLLVNSTITQKYSLINFSFFLFHVNDGWRELFKKKGNGQNNKLHTCLTSCHSNPKCILLRNWSASMQSRWSSEHQCSFLRPKKVLLWDNLLCIYNYILLLCWKKDKFLLCI